MIYVNILVLILAHVRSLSAYTSCATRYHVQDMCYVSYGEQLTSLTVTSLLACLTYCEADVPLCRSAVYNPRAKICATNKQEAFSVTTDCSSPVKYLTIHQSSCRTMTGDNCTSAAECFPPISECSAYTCGCIFGYNPNSDTSRCEISCDTYGNTYRQANAMKMTDVDEESLLGSSVEACKNACSSRLWCRTASFLSSFAVCTLTALTIGGNPSNFQVYSDWTTYHRECA